jgi:regulator of protease activity HflC (stomatin/prohibitin superfamily)
MSPFLTLVLVILILLLFSSIKILREYERAVIFRLGRLIKTKGPGIIILIPFVDKMVRVTLRTVAFDVQPQDVITKDNVSIKVNAVLYFKVIMPERAIVEVENYLFATNQIAQTTLRSILGQSELDDLLAERDKINHKLQEVIDLHTEPWGIKVESVEVKQIDLPLEMQRAMARQAEAEREKRSKIINADGEFQAAQKLTEAAELIQKHPIALQLRFMQTLSEISVEKNSTIIFPVPIDLLSLFMKNPDVNLAQKVSEAIEMFSKDNKKIEDIENK